MQATSQELLNLQFYEWIKKGLGWTVWEHAVEPEPPFSPFVQHYVPDLANDDFVDDAKKHTLLSFFLERGKQFLQPPAPKEDLPAWYKATFHLEPIPVTYQEDIIELELVIPREFATRQEVFEQFLTMIANSKGAIAMDFVASFDKISLVITCHPADKAHIISQLQIFFPEVVITEHQNFLREMFYDHLDIASLVDFGLREEFVRPINMVNKLEPDPLQGLFGIFENLKEGQLVAFQILFQGAVNPWVPSIMTAVSDGQGGSFFSNSPETVRLAQEKTSSPLFGVVVRALIVDRKGRGEQQLAKRIVNCVSVADRIGSNGLIPLSNKGYPFYRHVNDFLQRQSRRLGMLLNLRELMTFVHFPSPSIHSKKLNRQAKKTRPVPAIAQAHPYVLGQNIHKQRQGEVSLSPQQRLRHLHVIGATGTGKTTFLESLIMQDIQQGNGLAVLDPHGDMYESILSRIPPERHKDVILIDPADQEHPVGINLLTAHSEVEKIVISSDLVSMFKRLSSSWGDQMSAVFDNAIAAFLESDRKGTLLDLRRFLLEPRFRTEWLKSVRDPHAVYYWEKEFPQQKRSNSIVSLTTRLSIFLRPKLIRNMMAQPEGLDFAAIMNDQKILLVKLSQGIIGEENAYLLGTLIVAKLHQAAQGRQNIAKDQRNPFFLYIDEFQHFVTESMSGILSGARKYGLGLILAHQGLQQLTKLNAELANSVIANAGTRVCFRLGDVDAKKLEGGYAHFDSEDLQNLGLGEALINVGRAEDDCNMSTSMLETVDPENAEQTKLAVLTQSREKYGGSPTAAEEAFSDIRYTQTKTEKPLSKPQRPSSASTDSTPTPIMEESVPDQSAKELIEPPSQPGTQEESESKEVSKINVEEATKDFLRRRARVKETSEHQYLQTFIKKMGEARGYKATIEKPTPDGNGRVDVALENSKLSIACEISVTTKVDHEIGNLKKCLHAGYTYILACSKRPKHLAKIKEAATQAFNAQELEKLRFFLPKELVAFLDELSAQAASSEKRVKGYRVKVKYSSVDPKESKQRQSDISKAILDSLKNQQESKDDKPS